MTATSGSTYLLERAWVDGAVHDDVLVTVANGLFTSVTLPTDSDHFSRDVSRGERGFPRRSGETNATRIPGLTIPGLANCHSHAFHRALRGRTQRERGTFWTWRDRMYDVAATLDPDSYFTLARATYREMAAAGITCVGEFHYLHHQPDGTPYDDANAMGHALVEAAREAGIRICLLDTLYLSSGFGEPPHGVQRRFSDGSGQRWAMRQDDHQLEREGVVLGSAIHSVRAVPADQFQRVAEWGGGSPIHVHLSEQVAENQACVAEYARTPTEVLADHELLGPDTTVVHATHLTADDIRLLGSTRTNACFCPTTERDLGDGIGPSRQLHDAGAVLTLGSDSHAVIDLFEEMRAVELDERLATQERGHWSAPELLAAATKHGHASLGFDAAGAIAVGNRADLVTIDPSTARTAGTGRDENTAVFAATAEDVTQVMVDGRVVVRQGDREQVGRELDAAITAVWEGMS